MNFYILFEEATENVVINQIIHVFWVSCLLWIVKLEKTSCSLLPKPTFSKLRVATCSLFTKVLSNIFLKWISDESSSQNLTAAITDVFPHFD